MLSKIGKQKADILLNTVVLCQKEEDIVLILH